MTERGENLVATARESLKMHDWQIEYESDCMKMRVPRHSARSDHRTKMNRPPVNTQHARYRLIPTTATNRVIVVHVENRNRRTTRITVSMPLTRVESVSESLATFHPGFASRLQQISMKGCNQNNMKPHFGYPNIQRFALGQSLGGIRDKMRIFVETAHEPLARPGQPTLADRLAQIHATAFSRRDRRVFIVDSVVRRELRERRVLGVAGVRRLQDACIKT